ncbi:DUF317 domain-containing protein [Streptomyces broussonetiae]|uniref:DUF317 domain-containing protein n=1 Tax=Streptomyces broussonetiae TaxID=2686304 RepID=UPI0035DBC445
MGTSADPEAWFVTVTLGMHQTVWQARFGAHTPPHLVAALGDPKPVRRTDSRRSLSPLDANVVIRRTTDVLAVYVAGAREDRVHSLAARHTTTPTAPSPSRHAPPRHGRSR